MGGAWLLMALASVSAEAEPLGAEDRGAQDNAILIPEPLRFDLVRPLGPDAWEVEANVLVEVPLRSDPVVEWAPEIEVALPGGVALELELPIEDTTVEAIKGAGQVTTGTIGASSIHGVQLIVEGALESSHWEISPLFLFGHRFSERWSALGMLGVRTTVVPGNELRWEVLANPNLFFDVSPHLSLGLEGNFAIETEGAFEVVALPQVHWEPVDVFMVQAGLGGRFTDARSDVLFATRVIVSY